MLRAEEAVAENRINGISVLDAADTVLVPCGSEIRMATLAGQTFLSALKSEVFSMEDDPEDADETVSCSIDRLLNICC